MSVDEDRLELGSTWRDKLSQSPFLSHAEDVKPHSVRAFESEESLIATDDSNHGAGISRHTTKTAGSEEIAKPVAIIAQLTSTNPLLYTCDPAGQTTASPPSMIDNRTEQDDVKESDKGLQTSHSASSRRKQLSTIFSAWMPASSNSSDRVSGRSGVRSKRAEGTSDASGAESEPIRSPTIGQSISQGVKSLQHRHRQNKEATEAFKSMKLEEGGSASGEASASKESIAETLEGQAPTQHSNAHNPEATVNTNAYNDIPEEMVRGEMMLKVTPKKVKQRLFRLESDRGQIYWESKRNNKVNLESIREVRTGAAASSYRTSMSISASHEPRWISIIYQTEGVYKAVHLIALSDTSFQRWTKTLSAVQNERKMLMSGIDMLDQRQQLWLRQHWKAADSSQDSRLSFTEVIKLCRRLGILSNGKDLLSRFQQADTKGKGYLNFEDFQSFVNLLKRRIDIEALFLQWADAGVRQNLLQGCDYSSEEGQEHAREMLHEAVQQATMSRAQLGRFLAKEQGYSRSEAVDFVMSRYGQDQVLFLSGFASFLMSSDNAVLSDQSTFPSIDIATSMKERGKAETTDELIAMSSVEKTTQDMTRPLSEYYISSSHNTYLVGGQWKGDSTVEGYIRALMQGARSVEIDCWNGPGNEPQVTHGMTLTSKVPFRDVVVAIERYAFMASPFPLILSLEVHNDVVQQDALATILKEVLGDKLLSAPLSRSKDAMQSLPSPQDLRGKVLVKAKNLLVPETVPPVDDQDNDAMPFLVAEKRSSTSTTTTDTTESESDHLLQSARGLIRSVTKRKANRQGDVDSKSQTNKVLISPLLASLLIYTIGVKHRGINKKEYYAIEHMISLSEKSGIKYLRSDVQCEDLIKHNKSHLTRVYPSMSSFKRLSQSANFLPSLFWCMGCQLVAVNWQTLDVGFEMNQAMFSRNAKVGYVLKPEILRLKELSSKSIPRKKITVQVSIRVISAQQLPRLRDASRERELDNDDVIDPFVSLCVILPQHRDYSVRSVKQSPNSGKRKRQSGMQSLLENRQTSPSTSPSASISAPSDDATVSSASNNSRSWLCRQRTSVVKANGFNPIWDETLTFAITLNNTASQPIATATCADDIQSIQAYTRGLLDLCFLRFEVGEKVKMSLSRSNTSDDSIPGEAVHESRNADESDSSGYEDNSVDLESLGDGTHCLATHMISLGSLAKGYRHVPLYDAQLSQYLFSTLFIKTDMHVMESA
jgi:phosphatidylinositol phospholipase C delta